MVLFDLVTTSKLLSRTTKRLEKFDLLARLLLRLESREVRQGVAFLSGNLRQGRIGIGPATLRDVRPPPLGAPPSLTLTQVDEAFDRIAAVSGPGSERERHRLFGELMARATGEEQDFLLRLVLGDLRQGALEGIMVEAISRAAKAPAEDVRRAVMMSNDLGAVARAALEEGPPGLKKFTVRLFHPIQPMLAETAEDVDQVLEKLETAAFEYKLDGARVQAHKSSDEVRIFTRHLKDVTSAVPEIVEMMKALPAREVILDGEVLALLPDGTPHSFQTTMKRFGRKLNVEAMRDVVPLTPFFFDCLWLGGEALLDRRGKERFEALSDAVPANLLLPRIITSDGEEARSFLREALDAGHEGVMAKALDIRYDAGGRGRGWLKLKPAQTLDLVILAAEWGSGRRRGWLSNLHLGARDPTGGGFVMLGKTFKGMTDQMLQWQTERLTELEISRDRWTVYVRPELVVEVAFNDIQVSPTYPGGLALRFARIKRYRPDRSAESADTIETVRSLQQRRAGYVRRL